MNFLALLSCSKDFGALIVVKSGGMEVERRSVCYWHKGGRNHHRSEAHCWYQIVRISTVSNMLMESAESTLYHNIFTPRYLILQVSVLDSRSGQDLE